jgi:hypothetical protein
MLERMYKIHRFCIALQGNKKPVANTTGFYLEAVILIKLLQHQHRHQKAVFSDLLRLLCQHLL